MRLTIANISRGISASDFRTAVRAIRRQVNEDFGPEWSLMATLRSTTISLHEHQAPIEGKHDAVLYVGDSSQDPTLGVEGALGYHSKNHGDVAYGFVYLDVCKAYGEVWTTTLSHEALELLADPTAVINVTGPAPKGRGSVYYDLEVCDPTQGDAYDIDGVSVSNFVCRHYFRLTGGSGHTNFLDLPLKPFGVRPGGYCQYEDKSGVHQINGQKVTDTHRAARALMKDARRNTRRAARTIVAD